MSGSKTLLLTLIGLLLYHTTIAQQIFYLLDGIKGVPIEGAYVVVEGILSKSHAEVISDASGKVLVKETPPYIMYIQHLGYTALADTVHDAKTQTLYLFPSSETLEEIVVTGQYEPQSARNAVYKIKTISAERIEHQAANSLEGVLGNELNFRFSRDNAIGNSNLVLQGLSGQNVKILLDGIPMVGKSGTTNAIDINQINVNSIERIEIVEGAQAVNFGADALAGVINIITKKETDNRLSVDVALQEETVGREFSLFDDGLHNVAASVGYKPHGDWYVSTEARLNRFGGWTGSGDSRDKEWHPKTQYFFGGFTQWKRDKVNLYYRVDFMDELIENKGLINNTNHLKDPFAIDEAYNAQRFMHQLQGQFDIGKASLQTAASYTDYERTTHQFNSNIATGSKQTTKDSEQDTTFYSAFYFRSELVNALSWPWGKTQFGVDGQMETARGSTLSKGNKSMEDLGAFASVELNFKNKLKVRPGVRFTYNSVYEVKPTSSINFKYDINKQTQLRMGYGRGFRAPSIRELYHEFIDANHNIVGNEDLTPEQSHNLTGDLTYKLDKWPITFSIDGFYNYINNRITFFTPEQTNQPTTYINMALYKTTGGALSADYKKDNLYLKTGFAYVGRYEELSEKEGKVPEFLFSPEAIVNAQYAFKNSGWSLSTFYKYTGAMKRYRLVDEVPELRQLNAYHFMDATLKKSFKKSFSVSLGAHNIFNVTSVQSNNNSDDAHGGSSNGQAAIAYGRSYFIRLNYQFKQ